MIYLEKGQDNVVALTLTESSTITIPYYLFKFQWETDMESAPIYWTGSDTSPYKERYNLFTIATADTVDWFIGQYTYTIYESITPITIDENTTEVGLDEIEEGRMVLNGTGTTIYD